MKLREIERLRGFAVLIVMLHHWDFLTPLLLRPYMTDGRRGVDLFFVISGYVVTLSLLRVLPAAKPNARLLQRIHEAGAIFRTFYVRRALRIAPLALLALLLHRVGVEFLPERFGTQHTWNTEILAILSGIYNYVRPGSPDMKLGYFWSLTVEEHFYLLLPLLLVACGTRHRRIAVSTSIIVLIAFVVRPMSHPSPTVDRELYGMFASHLRFDTLMAGVLLALLLPPSHHAGAIPRAVAQPLLVGVAALLWSMPTLLPRGFMLQGGNVLEWLLGCVLVGFASLDQGYVFQLPIVSRFLEYVGARSYALYLIHTDVGRLLFSVWPHWSEYPKLVRTGPPGLCALGAIAFATAFIIAELLHRTVEAPVRHWGELRLAYLRTPYRVN